MQYLLILLSQIVCTDVDVSEQALRVCGRSFNPIIGKYGGESKSHLDEQLKKKDAKIEEQKLTTQNPKKSEKEKLKHYGRRLKDMKKENEELKKEIQELKETMNALKEKYVDEKIFLLNALKNKGECIYQYLNMLKEYKQSNMKTSLKEIFINDKQEKEKQSPSSGLSDEQEKDSQRLLSDSSDEQENESQFSSSDYSDKQEDESKRLLEIPSYVNYSRSLSGSNNLQNTKTGKNLENISTSVLKTADGASSSNSKKLLNPKENHDKDCTGDYTCNYTHGNDALRDVINNKISDDIEALYQLYCKVTGIDVKKAKNKK